MAQTKLTALSEENINLAADRAQRLMNWEIGLAGAEKIIASAEGAKQQRGANARLKTLSISLRTRHNLPDNVYKSEAQHTLFSLQQIRGPLKLWSAGTMAPEEARNFVRLLDEKLDVDWGFVLLGQPIATLDREAATKLIEEIAVRNTMAGLPSTTPPLIFADKTRVRLKTWKSRHLHATILSRHGTFNPPEYLVQLGNTKHVWRHANIELASTQAEAHHH